MYFPRLFSVILLALLVATIAFYFVYILQKEEQWLANFGYCRLEKKGSVGGLVVDHTAKPAAAAASASPVLPVKRIYKQISMSTFRRQQQKEFDDSQRLLKDIDALKLQNSEILPTTSYFGTTNGSSICEGEDEQRCVPKFKDFEARLRLLPNHKIEACIIQKNMSTVLQAIICYLLDAATFLKAGRSIKTEHHRINLCKKKNEINAGVDAGSLVPSQIKRLNDKWKLISISRHPVDRLLSGFVDKCIRKPIKLGHCNRCYGNLTCFLVTEYKRMMIEAPKMVMKRTFEDRHFFPQNWRCNYKALISNYSIIQYEKAASYNASNGFLDQLSSLLLQQNVSTKEVGFIRQELKSFRTVHSTADTDARSFFEKRLVGSPFLMEFVHRMFYWDFKLFNYSLPDISFAPAKN